MNDVILLLLVTGLLILIVLIFKRPACDHAERVGFKQGPDIVTVTRSWPRYRVNCPACQGWFTIKKHHLGSTVTCPQPDCGIRLQVNHFPIKVGS